MTKLDPNNPVIRFMLTIILLYSISSYVLTNIIQKDYDYDAMKNKLLLVKKSEDLNEHVNEIEKISKTRFYLLMSVFGVLFISYVYYKTQTDKSESTAIIFAICLSLSGKLIEKLGLANCLTLPVIDPKGSPGNVLLFDMFYTNFFAYFLDFIYAFAAVIVLSGEGSILNLFKSKKFSELLKKNLSFYADGKIRFKNMLRFLLYLGTIIIFWNWGSIIRPKVTLLLHRYLGIPVVDKNKLDLEENKGENGEKKEGHELVATISSIGILSASVVEGLIFTGLLFPMRKFFLYELGNTSEYNSSKMSIFSKFIGLVLIIPICIILFTKYTLASNNPEDYKYPKMISLILGQYILIPIVLFMIQSLSGIKMLDYVKKHKNIFTIFYVVVPIIMSMILTLTGNNGMNYIEDNPKEEKIVEAYMSESVAGECGDSNTKFKYVVGLVTLIMTIFSFGPFLTIHKLHPITGILYFIILSLVIRIIYMFQDNYESYNILNPMRHSKDSEGVDLDSAVSIETTMITIFTVICLLVFFRQTTQ